MAHKDKDRGIKKQNTEYKNTKISNLSLLGGTTKMKGNGERFLLFTHFSA